MDLPTSDRYHAMSVESFETEKLLTNAARQRDARKLNEFPIFDADAHHYESESITEIIDYIDDDIINHLARANPAIISTGRGGYQPMGGRITRYPLRKIEQTPADGVHRDVHLSRRWMDAMGIDYIGLFPTGMLGIGLIPQVEMIVFFVNSSSF